MIKFIDYFKEKKPIKKEFEKDEDCRTIINISVSDKSQILSPFHYENKEIINEEFAGLLDNIIISVPPKQKVRLNLKCGNISDNEKEKFAHATKNYYQNKIIDSQLRIKNALIVFSISLVLALVFLALLFVSNFFNGPFILNEVIDILVWIFLWEAFDIVIFQRSLLRLERQRYNALYKCKICFV